MSLAPDAYINSLYEPPDMAQEPLLHHHFNVNNNYYRGFTYLNNRLTICLYTKVYNSQGTSTTPCVFNPWVVFISYWASLVVCMSADFVQCLRPHESLTKDITNMTSTSSANLYTLMSVDRFEFELRVVAVTSLRTYAAGPDMPGSSS